MSVQANAQQQTIANYLHLNCFHYLLIFFFIITKNEIVSGSLSRQCANLAIYAKTSRSYGNNANVFIADNIVTFKVHLVIKFVALSLLLTVPSLCHS